MSPSGSAPQFAASSLASATPAGWARSSRPGLRRSGSSWPGTPGPLGSRRDGTLLVHTKDAVWAFELGHRGAEILSRLGRRPEGCEVRRRDRFRRLRSRPAETERPAPARADRRAVQAGRGAGRRNRRRGAAQTGRGGRRSEPRERRRRPVCLVDFNQPESGANAGLFLMAETAYTAKDITVLEGLEPVRLRPGMYIGSTGSRGPPPPRLRGRRQLGRRGSRGPQRPDRGHDPPRQLRHRARLGLGHPRRHHARAGSAGPDGRADQAPRRRQVRRRGLQGLRRPARRRRLGRQRALGVADRRGAPRRQGLPAGVRARRAAGRHGGRRRGRRRTTPARTIDFLPDAEIFDDASTSRSRRSSSACARRRS